MMVTCAFRHIIFIFAARPGNRNPRHMYIVNLASSGIVMSMVCVPPTLLQILYGGWWHLGLFACKLVPAIQGKMDKREPWATLTRQRSLESSVIFGQVGMKREGADNEKGKSQSKYRSLETWINKPLKSLYVVKIDTIIQSLCLRHVCKTVYLVWVRQLTTDTV